MRMSVRSAGVPTKAPNPPAVNPQAAFCHKGRFWPLFISLALILQEEATAEAAAGFRPFQRRFSRQVLA
jgi:hypothetical protein